MSFAVYRLLLLTVGLHHYWPYRLLLTSLDVLCGVLLFLLLRRNVHPILAASGAAILMLLGPAWQDLLWPFQVCFLGSVAGGLTALYLSPRNSRYSDIAVALCLLVAVCCCALGVAFSVALIVETAIKRRWRQLWAPVVPLVGFVIWYVIEDRTPGATTIPSVGTTGHFLSQAAAATFGALWGGAHPCGQYFPLSSRCSRSRSRSQSGSRQLASWASLWGY